MTFSLTVAMSAFYCQINLRIRETLMLYPQKNIKLFEQYLHGYHNFLQLMPISVLGSLFLGVIAVQPIKAQSVIPSANSAGTIVNRSGDQFNITGGTQAGANLYQSFQQFGLTPSQIANFQSNPSIQNILGRIVGGNPSVINGRIQVTGGNSNLFLMNPAGIIFGASASLNVPASFTATTANGIQVGNQWFGGDTSVGVLQTLTGAPNGLAFTTAQSGDRKSVV